MFYDLRFFFLGFTVHNIFNFTHGIAFAIFFAYPFSSLPACTHWKNFSEHNAHNDYGFTTSQDKYGFYSHLHGPVRTMNN